MLVRRTVLLSAGAPLLPAATGAEALDKNLQPLARFLGKWRGEGDGQPGHSTVERTYEAMPSGHFIVARNTSAYAPQPKNPKGEVHTDLGWFSYDRAARAVVLRQFHYTEAFVNTYASPVDRLSDNAWVFASVALENIPAGFRARETYTFSGADAFEERFEVAAPGKDYETYSLNRLRRA
jgi:hypothetical protein